MKKLSIIISVMSIICLCLAVPRGTTHKEIDCNGVISGQLKAYSPVTAPASGAHNISKANPLSRDEWIPVDSVQFNKVLRAGNQYGIQFYSPTQSFMPCSSMGMLTQDAINAVAKSPNWIKPDLENVLSQLNNDKQNTWAELINSANDPYIDEIAFSIAHSSVLYLSSNLADPTLFVENAQKLYEIDGYLPYVQIVNHGSSLSNPDYYSTTSYFKMNVDSTLSTVEVPRDTYYWYIVHPKVSDEIPAYINPALVENNSSHSNNIAPAPEGQFWRSFFYSYSEGTYPVLGTALEQCQTLFNRNGVPGDAIRAIQSWINSTMGFNSNSERPHQPVRIYAKHMGRCGEYADYTQAAARTALIPCTQILSASTDHVWNEFWEDGWMQWEPVNGYINVPLVYEDGWGKVFGSVMEIRSDGFLTNVTERYSSGSSLIHINVTDSLGIPVDGARLIVAILDGATNRFDTVVFTDNNGDVSFTVGDNRQYSVRVESTVGWYPQPVGTYQLITANSIAGQTYDFQIELPYAKPMPVINPLPIPTDDVQDWKLAVMFDVTKQIITGVVAWDDIDVVGSQAIFNKDLNQTGKVNLLMTDSDNYMFYNVAHTADAFHVLNNVQTGVSVFDIPAQTDWYAFLDAANYVANAQYVSGMTLYRHYGVSNEDDVAALDHSIIYPNAPNPFNTATTIRFALSKEDDISLSIYNIKGQKVKSLQNGVAKAGINALTWNGSDESDKPCGSGIYYLRLTDSRQTITRKMLLLK